jgi:hypothetical protein
MDSCCIACCMLCVERCMLRVARHVARCTLHVARCTLHVARCTLHSAHSMLNIAHCTLHIACCMLHVACSKLHIPCCMMHVACCMMHVAHCMLHVSEGPRPKWRRLEPQGLEGRRRRARQAHALLAHGGGCYETRRLVCSNADAGRGLPGVTLNLHLPIQALFAARLHARDRPAPRASLAKRAR